MNMMNLNLVKTQFDHPEDFLSSEEKQSIKETFELFDKDGDGCLNERELKKALEGTQDFCICVLNVKELGQHPTSEEILRMINEVDQENKGCIGKTYLK